MMLYTHEYDSSYPNGPAMPIVVVTLKAIGQETRTRIEDVIVDSGADATILPLSSITQAEVDEVGRAKMRWGTHSGRDYAVYLATIEIGPFSLPGIRILADPSNKTAVLGRNVLNQLVVTLNGLANTVEIRD